VVSWIASRRVSRASLSAPPESGEGWTTRATFGRMSDASSPKSSRRSSSSRTLPESVEWRLMGSFETLPTSGSMRNGRISARATLELRTSGGECGSSAYWPTPTATHGGTQQNGICASKPSGGSPTLYTIGRRWTSARHGRPTEASGRAVGQLVSLNPAFMERLMGLPDGWTDTTQSVTGLSPWLRRMRSVLSRVERLEVSTDEA
jgi:hypothetical protein